MVDNAEKKKVLHFMGRLLDHICKYVPVAGFLYDSVEKLVCDDMPPHINFMTDGSVLFIRDDIVPGKNCKPQDIRHHISNLAHELSHELMHIMLGHPGKADLSKRACYDLECDAEVSRYSDFSWKEDSFLNGRDIDSRYDLSHELWYLDALSEEIKNFLNNHLQELQEILATLANGGIPSEDGSDMYPDMSGMSWEISADIELSDTMQMLREVAAEKRAEFHDTMYGLSEGCESTVISHVPHESVKFEDELKRYVTVREQSCETDDELDYVMYTYGLSMYGNIPIVEPPEETERTSASFYLAVDCSGSIDVELAERFLGQVKDVVSKVVNDDRNTVDIDLFIFDTQVTQSFHIEKAEDFPDYKDIELKGGGTSFIPLIEKVGELAGKKGQTDTALFCFSDGMGDFPQEKPKFDVFFVMEGGEHSPYEQLLTGKMPDWVRVLDL